MGTWIEMTFPLTVSLTRASSFPAMGTWIEMSDIDKAIKDIDCRSLQWERGLKFFSYFHWVPAFRRSLQWERGLKYILGGCLVSS